MNEARWLAFGDLDAGRWGAAWIPGETAVGHVALGTAEDAEVRSAELDSDDDGWRLRGDGLELDVSGANPDAGSERGLERVSGSFTLSGSEHSVDALAWRESLSLPEPGELDSLRLLAAWLAGDEGLTLAATRPRKARGQEADLTSAVLVDSGGTHFVSDPRLSTTYDGNGVPSRAGVELWVQEPSEDPEEASERPHRFAGEASGPRAAWSEGWLELGAQPFRWHGHGVDGAGVYLLGRSG